MAMQEANTGVGDGIIPPGRRPEFRIVEGGIVREGDIRVDAPQVLRMYKAPHTMEHLADVTPEDRVGQITEYYRKHPNAHLLIADIPGEGIVGAVTAFKEEGLRSVKLNRLVVRADYRNRGVATMLARAGLSKAFSSEAVGGLGAESVIVGIIQDVDGSELAMKTFRKLDFQAGSFFNNRCDSWNIKQGRLVPRDVITMLLQKWPYSMKRGKDLIK